MRISMETVAVEHEWVHDRVDVVVPLINVVRGRLGPKFGTTVDDVTAAAYHDAVDAVFADGDRAVNATGLIRLLRELDVEGDYPGFVVDELLGRELAAVLAGDQPRRLIAEATFHYADLVCSEQMNRPGRHVQGDSTGGGPGDPTDGDPEDPSDGDSVEPPGGDSEGPLDADSEGPLDADSEGPPRDVDTAGADDLDAALAAGIQTRLPGWGWTDQPSPFGVD